LLHDRLNEVVDIVGPEVRRAEENQNNGTKEVWLAFHGVLPVESIPEVILTGTEFAAPW
jgi:hypothetical protein